MASNAATLSSMIMQNIDANMKKIQSYAGPMGQPDPSYFQEFCTAVAAGISQGSTAINFATKDKGTTGSPPVPGAGLGVGIFIDREWFHKELYVQIRAEIITVLKTTLHDEFPPKKGNTGEFLDAVCKGISDAVTDHFHTAYNLQSVHPQIYAGRGDILEGMFFGLSPSNIASLIVQNGPRLKGVMFPPMMAVIARVYVLAVHQHATSFVTIQGSCSPSPSQVCGINSTGAGTGVAV